ncbi:Putative Proteophosphoglycan ppg4 [Rhizopus microsporus]|nr:Putative Proteophosphoglycan ppg4 [Rhizopus microsporus]
MLQKKRHAADDESTINVKNTEGNVDYLSYNFDEMDLAASWRVLTKQKLNIINGIRLENASWRTWAKQRNNLKTVSPETLNWLKDSDVTWLYGPLHTVMKQDKKHIRPLPSPLQKPQEKPLKSALKKVTMSDLLKRSASELQIHQNNPKKKDDDLSASSSLSISKVNQEVGAFSPSVIANHRQPKLRFNQYVEQCIALTGKSKNTASDDTDSYEPDDDDDDDNDDNNKDEEEEEEEVIMMKPKLQQKIRSIKKIEPTLLKTSSRSDESSTSSDDEIGDTSYYNYRLPFFFFFMSFFKSKKNNKQQQQHQSDELSTSSIASLSPLNSLKDKPTNEEIDRLFEEAATRLNLNTSDASVRSLPSDKKWFILCHENALSSIGTLHSTSLESYANKTPSYYINAITKRDSKWEIRCKLVSDLSVRLRTMPIKWAQEFIEQNGIRTLCEELASINKINARNQKECQLEFEIIKCLRQLFSNYYGIQQVISDPFYIIQLTQSILSPSIPTQRLVCDALTFMCYFEQPKGHSIVLQGMETIRETKSDYGPFDSWLRAFHSTLDNHNKTVNTDIPISEHALANLLLINAIVDPDTVQDIEYRMTLRNQLYQGGLAQVLEKLKLFNNELINIKLEEFHESEDNDNIAHMVVVATINGTKAYDYFQKLLQDLLLIQCDSETRNRYYQLIEHFVSQVTFDRNSNSFTSTYGVTVKDLIAKFAEEDELEEALQEADEAREIAAQALEREAALRVQLDLKADGLVGQLRLKNEALERSLRIANQTNAVLQQRLDDIELDHKKTLESMDSQIQRLYETVNILVQSNHHTQPSEPFDALNNTAPCPPCPPAPNAPPASTAGTQQPRQKLKFVEWEKIHRRQLGNTIWEHLEDDDQDDIIDSNDDPADESLFNQQSIVSKLSHADVFTLIEKTFAQKPAASDLSKRKRKATDSIELLDPKKAHAMSIFLTSLPKEFEIKRLAEYVLDISPYIQVELVLENFLKFAPSSEEAETLKKYKESGESIERLSKPDQLVLEMVNINQFKPRISCLLYKTVFWDKVEGVEKALDLILKASESLLHAKRFKKLLQMILVLGNFMNGNTSRGGAFGIKITSINKLIDTKSTSNTSSTLLHFIVEIIEKSFPKVLEFLDELKYCEEASKVNKTEVMTDFCEIKNGLKQFDVLSGDDSFTEIMKHFQTEAESKVSQVEQLQVKSDELFQKTVSFYGENVQTVQSNEFFKIFHTFITSWQKCTEDLKLAKKTKERLEAQKRIEAERRNQAKSSKGKGIDISDCI